MLVLDFLKLHFLLEGGIVPPSQVELLSKFELLLQGWLGLVSDFLDSGSLILSGLGAFVNKVTVEQAFLLDLRDLVLVNALPLVMSQALIVVKLSQLALVHHDSLVGKMSDVFIWQLTKFIQICLFFHVHLVKPSIVAVI